LIDGLHEELNIRQEKPYIENPESQNRNMLELGLESYSNNLKRDFSFIFFLFYGTIKSSIQCKDCSKLSNTFDLFTNIPLSLPEPTKTVLYVTVYRLPNEIKDLLKGDGKSVLRRIESAKSEDFRVSSQQQKKRDQIQNLQTFQESFKYMTNDSPIHVCVQVDKDSLVHHVVQKVCEIRDVNVEMPATGT